MEATVGTGTHGAPGVPDAFQHPRGLFCNRTLNLRKIQAVGYDMDYTLVHYHVALWEERAYAYIKNGLKKQGWPVDDLVFDPVLVVQGLKMRGVPRPAAPPHVARVSHLEAIVAGFAIEAISKPEYLKRMLRIKRGEQLVDESTRSLGAHRYARSFVKVWFTVQQRPEVAC